MNITGILYVYFNNDVSYFNDKIWFIARDDYTTYVGINQENCKYPICASNL